MKARSILMFALATLFLVSLANAASLSSFTITAPENVTHDASSFTMTFVVNNSLGTAATAENIDLSLSGQTGTYTIAFSEDPVSITAGEVQAITATVTFSAHQSGTFAGTITQTPVTTSTELATFSVPILSNDKITLSTSSTLTKTKNGSISVKNNGNTALSNINLTASGPLPITFSNNGLALSAGSSSTIVVSADSLADLVFGTNTISILAKDLTTGTTSSATSFSVEESFCELGHQGGNLSLAVDISNDGEGDDDEWRYLDKITVEVDVKYDGNSDDEVQDINLEIGLFDNNGKNIANKLNYLSSDDDKRVDLGNMDTDSDEETVSYEFIVPADLDDGNYKLAIKAYSRDSGEDFECIDTTDDFNNQFFQTIKIKKETDNDKQIAFDEIRINPADLVCGDTVQIDARAFHVGDQDQDQVLIILKNSELDLDLRREIRNFDQGDDADLTYSFIIPQNAQEKTYTMELDARYDYKERSDAYGESLEATHKFPLRVIGGCSASSSTGSTGLAGITASLISEAKAGSELVIKTTISNTESTAKGFVMDASGFDSWATIGSISERIVTLGPQQSADVTIKLNVKKGVSGQQSFTVTAQSGNEVSTKQVAVNIAGSPESVFSGNGWLWAVGLVNIILIILIIIVAVRLASR